MLRYHAEDDGTKKNRMFAREKTQFSADPSGINARRCSIAQRPYGILNLAYR